MTVAQVKRTSLYARHRAAGARMVEFGGWEMPVQYAGIVDEHRAVRSAAGLFDVSHMGEIEIRGAGALESVQRLITNDAARLAIGQGLYSPMCGPDGGILDDLTVFRLAADRYLLVVNAATSARDASWMMQHTQRAQVLDRSSELALLALQGPRAQAILQLVTPADLAGLRSFHLLDAVQVAGCNALIARTGYTGEDGFEIACAWDDAPRLWDALLEAGQRIGLVPAGLGARYTLRLEASYTLYGSDIDETTSPLEARLGWTVKFDKGEFIGRDALVRQRERGLTRRLVGLEMLDRAIPRRGYPVFASPGATTGDAPVGVVTSGTFGPSVGKSIAMGYVGVEQAAVGTAATVEIRGRRAPARIVKLPFYERKS